MKSNKAISVIFGIMLFCRSSVVFGLDSINFSDVTLGDKWDFIRAVRSGPGGNDISPQNIKKIYDFAKIAGENAAKQKELIDMLEKAALATGTSTAWGAYTAAAGEVVVSAIWIVGAAAAAVGTTIVLIEVGGIIYYEVVAASSQKFSKDLNYKIAAAQIKRQRRFVKALEQADPFIAEDRYNNEVRNANGCGGIYGYVSPYCWL